MLDHRSTVRFLRLRLDEVFEEEESAEVEGDSARPCHPVCDRGRRIQPAEREPRRRLKGEILHAQREAMRIFVLYRFGGMLETIFFFRFFKVFGVLSFSW